MGNNARYIKVMAVKRDMIMNYLTTGRYVVIAFFLLLLPFGLTAQARKVSDVWVADNGNGTYKNPVLNADYSDPDAIRVGDDYYLVSSSFNCMPGLPVLHSKDLVNWAVINYALKKQEPATLYDIPQHGKGVWAPCIRYHNNEFYIYYPDPDYGIYMIKTKDVAGEWSKPILVLPGKGIIDPAPFWDDNGKAYLAVAWAASRAFVNSLITLFTMNIEGTKVTDEGRNVYDGHDANPTIEGPKLYKRNGYYYIFSPAGGVSAGWQLALRSKEIYGPYEARVVMDQGKTNINGPHQGAWVETQTGESWFLHFQDKGPYGRVVHLEPMKWVNNWPVIGNDPDGDGKGEPVAVYKKPDVGKTYSINTPAESDEFNDSQPGLQWQWQANPKVQWAAEIPASGHLRLFAFPYEKDSPNLWNVPNLLLQKLPAPDFTATTKVNLKIEWEVWQSKKAGLLMMGNDYAYLSISKDDKGYKVSQVICKKAADGTTEDVVEEKRINGAEVYLRVAVKGPGAVCHFSYSEDGKSFKPIGSEFYAQPDKWIGAKVGMFCVSSPDVRIGGYADFDWFRVQNINHD
ncbi:Beta-xylosidase [Mucilaginibacter mallensis]|uniref:Beta-xylosidase n=2 Tax=Mucilaginibacter mallensis TaxID=652787 RepID=A0A1H1ZR52_MUCMA|nr:Beta-xylosidase [Mucilaginibacter mallensis]